jgi:peptidoglycan/xylan/chitin deacetylase (PgdA/CDA1 family)
LAVNVALAIVGAAIAAVCIDLGAGWVFGRLAKLDLQRRTRKARAVVLTFDDGPGNRLTPAILDILAQRNAKATFFLLGRNIPGREAIVRRIAAQGHEIASHGFHHAHPWKTGPLHAINDIGRGWRTIDAAEGNRNGKRAFRPPYGKVDLVTLIYLWLKRVTVCYWTVDSTDTGKRRLSDRGRAAELVHQNGGGVVLTHDFDRPTDEIDQAVLESVVGVLDVARRDRLNVMTFSELIHGAGNN